MPGGPLSFHPQSYVLSCALETDTDLCLKQIFAFADGRACTDTSVKTYSSDLKHQRSLTDVLAEGFRLCFIFADELSCHR